MNWDDFLDLNFRGHPAGTQPVGGDGLSDTTRPLHVRVAEALGWTQIGPGNSMNMGDPGIGYPPTMPIVGHKEPLPRYDTDWSATGPLIERLNITMCSPDAQGDQWSAGSYGTSKGHGGWVEAYAETPLIAVCNLILALKEAGKL